MNDKKIAVPSFSDKANNSVIVGDFIVYGHNLGRCAGLRFGKVLKIEKAGESWRIGVQGIDDDWDFRGAHLAGKGTLQFPERILNANKFIPDNYKELLK